MATGIHINAMREFAEPPAGECQESTVKPSAGQANPGKCLISSKPNLNTPPQTGRSSSTESERKYAAAERTYAWPLTYKTDQQLTKLSGDSQHVNKTYDTYWKLLKLIWSIKDFWNLTQTYRKLAKLNQKLTKLNQKLTNSTRNLKNSTKNLQTQPETYKLNQKLTKLNQELTKLNHKLTKLNHKLTDLIQNLQNLS